MQLCKTNEYPEDLEVNYNIFETYVHKNPVPFATSLSLQKMLSDSWEKPSDLQQSCTTNACLEKCSEGLHHFIMTCTVSHLENVHKLVFR